MSAVVPARDLWDALPLQTARPTSGRRGGPAHLVRFLVLLALGRVCLSVLCLLGSSPSPSLSLSLCRSRALVVWARAGQSLLGSGVRVEPTPGPVAFPWPMRVVHRARAWCVVEGWELSVRRVRGPPDGCSEASLHGRRHEHGMGMGKWGPGGMGPWRDTPSWSALVRCLQTRRDDWIGVRWPALDWMAEDDVARRFIRTCTCTYLACNGPGTRRSSKAGFSALSRPVAARPMRPPSCQNSLIGPASGI